MSQLQLSLLGTPVVKHGECTLTFSTRKALALLVYLAVEGGTHPRKTLSEAFWPELDAEHGRAALRATLLELRLVRERAHEPGERARFQPLPQNVLVPGSGISSERFGAWLFAETHGQPFYQRALLQELLERGVLLPRLIEGGGWVFEPRPSLLEATSPNYMLPADVRDIILRRLARLSSPARNLLAAGGVLGRDFTFEEICQVSQLVPQDGLDALRDTLKFANLPPPPTLRVRKEGEFGRGLATVCLRGRLRSI